MRAAIEAFDAGADVAMISKLHPTRSHSGAAEGGINAALGNAAEWNNTDPDWLNLPAMDGAVRMRYRYRITGGGKFLTITSQGNFHGVGVYTYSESWQGSDPLAAPTEFPSF